MGCGTNMTPALTVIYKTSLLTYILITIVKSFVYPIGCWWEYRVGCKINRLWTIIRKKKEYCKKNPSAAKCKKEDRPSAENWKKATGNPDVNKHYFKTKEKAMRDAKKMGFTQIHTHKTEDGETLYMAGPDHKTFIKKHNERNK